MIISRQILPTVYIGGDIITFFLTFILISIISEDQYKESSFTDNYSQNTWITFLGLIVLWLVIGYWRKLYAARNNKKISIRIRLINYIKAYLILICLVLVFYLIFPFPAPLNQIVFAIVAGFPILWISLNFILLNLTSPSIATEEESKYALVAGVGEMAKIVEKYFLSLKDSDFKIKGFIKCNKEECLVGAEKVVGELKNIKQYLQHNKVDEIIIALPLKYTKKIKNILVAADYFGVRVKYIPDYMSLFGKNYKMTHFGDLDVINVRQLPLDETFPFFVKFIFDKVFSLCVLILLAPLYFIISILIKLESPGPVFYCPERIGKSGKTIKVFKFRSMEVCDNPVGGVMSTQQNDPRITKLGRVLRKYSLDELPQFLNVLLGDMSVVGPRPHRAFLSQKFQECEGKYMVRHYFKPGITGWAQVNGWRGPTDTVEQKMQRTYHDLWYFENWSLWLDVKIILLTIFSKKAHRSAF